MRRSLVPSVFPPEHAAHVTQGFRSRFQFLLPTLACAATLCVALGLLFVRTTPALAEGPQLYSSVALSNPGLPPVLATAEHTSLWTDDGRLRNQAVEALGVLAQATDHGLPKERYALKRLGQLAATLSGSAESTGLAEARFNELLTAAIETYAIDLLQGLQPSAFKDKRDPKHVSTGRMTMQSQLQAAVLKGLHRSIATNRVGRFIASIEPDHASYRELQAALQRYRRIAAQGNWDTIDSGPLLTPGDADQRVASLRARLQITDNAEPATATGPLQGVAATPALPVYDDALVAAVKRFQERHGLKPDGIVGNGTRRALNVSVADRIRQIELNLDRWRLMPKVMPANHIWVNVPEYRMGLQLDREEVLNMRVVVGKRKWPTPMMHDELEHLVFNPYWYPPRKIAVREILPKLQADPGYLDRQRFQVLADNKPVDSSTIDWSAITPADLNYRFRQRPGRNNSLGEVKFMFPNRYSVYMHDTNAKSLFDKEYRALSHGCIRLEDPAALATAILAWDRGWTNENVAKAMAGSRQKYIKLEQTLPVYLVYFTATANGDALYFHNDVYGHDARHIAQQEKLAPTLVAQILERHEPAAGDTFQGVSNTQEPATQLALVGSETAAESGAR